MSTTTTVIDAATTTTVKGSEETTTSIQCAVMIALAVLTPCLLVGKFASVSAAKTLYAICVLVTSTWAFADARRLKFREHKSLLMGHPFTLFTTCVWLWVIIFPAYLVVRSKIQAELLPKAANPRELRMLQISIAMWSVEIFFYALMLTASRYFR